MPCMGAPAESALYPQCRGHPPRTLRLQLQAPAMRKGVTESRESERERSCLLHRKVRQQEEPNLLSANLDLTEGQTRHTEATGGRRRPRACAGLSSRTVAMELWKRPKPFVSRRSKAATKKADGTEGGDPARWETGIKSRIIRIRIGRRPG